MTDVYVPYADAEIVGLALMDLLVPSTPGLTTGTFLRSGWTPPFIQVNRIGGAPDVSDITDYPILRLAVYGADRMKAWDLSAKAEGMVIGHRGRNVYVPEYGSEILIDSADIVVGGQQLPDVDPDDRRVVKDVILGMRRPYYLVST